VFFGSGTASVATAPEPLFETAEVDRGKSHFGTIFQLLRGCGRARTRNPSTVGAGFVTLILLQRPAIDQVSKAPSCPYSRVIFASTFFVAWH